MAKWFTVPEATPLLSRDEEAELLAIMWSPASTPEQRILARNHLVTSNLRLLAGTVHRSGVPARHLDNLASHLMHQLILAVSRYRAGHGTKISTFLRRSLILQSRGYARRYEALIPVPHCPYRSHEHQTGKPRNPELHAAAARAEATRLASELEDFDLELAPDLVPSPRTLMAQHDLADRVRLALNDLDPTLALVATLAFGLDDERCHSDIEIAARIGGGLNFRRVATMRHAAMKQLGRLLAK